VGDDRRRAGRDGRRRHPRAAQHAGDDSRPEGDRELAGLVLGALDAFARD
jgi:hypothetical protein